MNLKNFSFVFTLPTGAQIRVQQHKTDESKVAIKADNAAHLDDFAMLGGVDLKADKVQGSQHTMLLADKAATAEACKNIVMSFKTEPEKPAFVGSAAEEHDED